MKREGPIGLDRDLAGKMKEGNFLFHLLEFQCFSFQVLIQDRHEKLLFRVPLGQVVHDHLTVHIDPVRGNGYLDGRFELLAAQRFRHQDVLSHVHELAARRVAQQEKDQQERDIEILYYVGCSGSFDDRNKKVAIAFVKVLQAAGVSFAILGAEEKCCGDSVKRLGNEYLYQLLAQENLTNLARYKVKKIIVGCPHGYNTLKNEYPQLLPLLPDLNEEDKKLLQSIEVIHHSQFLEYLITTGRLKLKKPFSGRVIIHDSCYLSRHNQIIASPRQILKWAGQNQVTGLEAENSREHTFCCGAGGGLMWTEETQGTRINRQRTRELLSHQPEIIISACPFCQTMLSDGLKDENREDVRVLDLAQLLTEVVAI